MVLPLLLLAPFDKLSVASRRPTHNSTQHGPLGRPCDPAHSRRGTVACIISNGCTRQVISKLDDPDLNFSRFARPWQYGRTTRGERSTASAWPDLRWRPLLTRTCRRRIIQKNSETLSEGESRSTIQTETLRKHRDAAKDQQDGSQHRMVRWVRSVRGCQDGPQWYWV